MQHTHLGPVHKQSQAKRVPEPSGSSQSAESGSMPMLRNPTDETNTVGSKENDADVE